MASVVNDPNGRKRILFVAPGQSRKAIRLGKCDSKTAESIRRHLEALLAAKISGQPITRDTAAWLSNIGVTLRDKLAAVGLIESLITKLITKQAATGGRPYGRAPLVRLRRTRTNKLSRPPEVLLSGLLIDL